MTHSDVKYGDNYVYDTRLLMKKLGLGGEKKSKSGGGRDDDSLSGSQENVLEELYQQCRRTNRVMSFVDVEANLVAAWSAFMQIYISQSGESDARRLRSRKVQNSLVKEAMAPKNFNYRNLGSDGEGKGKEKESSAGIGDGESGGDEKEKGTLIEEIAESLRSQLSTLMSRAQKKESAHQSSSVLLWLEQLYSVLMSLLSNMGKGIGSGSGGDLASRSLSSRITSKSDSPQSTLNTPGKSSSTLPDPSCAAEIPSGGILDCAILTLQYLDTVRLRKFSSTLTSSTLSHSYSSSVPPTPRQFRNPTTLDSGEQRVGGGGDVLQGGGVSPQQIVSRVYCTLMYVLVAVLHALSGEGAGGGRLHSRIVTLFPLICKRVESIQDAGAARLTLVCLRQLLGLLRGDAHNMQVLAGQAVPMFLTAIEDGMRHVDDYKVRFSSAPV